MIVALLLACVPADPTPLTVALIPPGHYTRGSPSAPGAGAPSGRQSVTLTRPFLLTTTEITQALWQSITGTRPWQTETRHGEGRDHGPCPVGGVGAGLPAFCLTWTEAVAFANALSVRDGLRPAYVLDGASVTWDRDADGWRLPTEAEWEWAARAGADLRYGVAEGPDGLCAHANVADQALRRAEPAAEDFPCDDGHAALAPVASLAPNPWGLYDTTGNVWEWTWDRFAPWPAAAATDPVGPEVGAERTARGASWHSTRAHTEVAARIHGVPDTRGVRLGLRLARDAP